MTPRTHHPQLDPDADGPTADRWMLTVVAGPDAGASTVLVPGRHVIGRASGLDLRCDDQSWAAHHVLVDVRPRGAARLVQLAGRAPVRIDGRDVPRADGAWLVDGCWVEIGDSVLCCALVGTRPDVADPRGAAHVRDGMLLRSPRVARPWSTTAVVLPDPPEPPGETGGGLMPSLLGLAGSAVVAVVLRQPMFAVFGALGSLVGVGSWAGQRLARRRRIRLQREAHRAAVGVAAAALEHQREAWVAHHLAATPTLASACAAVSAQSSSLWSRRSDHHDVAAVSLGWGEAAWQPCVEGPATDVLPADIPLTGSLTGSLTWSLAGSLVGTGRSPVRADLVAGRHLAVRGRPERAAAMARSLVLQQVAFVGPADLRIVVVTDDPARWAWVASLPHARLPDGRAAVVDDDGLTGACAMLGEHPGRRLVVVDRHDWLGARTAPLRRIVHADGGRSIVLIVLVPPTAPIPHLCASALALGLGGVARWTPDTAADELPEPVVVAGLAERAAGALAGRLTGLLDPEDPLAASATLPVDVRLSDLLGNGSPGAPVPSAAAIVARWQAAGNDPAPCSPIGQSAEGLVDIDLVRDGPHGLIAGTTGSGKSELLRSLVAGLAARVGPDRLTFVLVDYKGGATFDACADLPHTVGVVTDLDDRLGARALRSLRAELHHREGVLRAHGATDLTMLRAVVPDVVLPRLVVVVDEFAALVAEQPGFLHALVGIAQRGRSLGMHLLLATQRPAGVVSDDIRANTNLRIALRLHDAAEAIDIVDDPGPAALARGVPGRAVMRLGPDDRVMFQAARCAGDLPALVAAVREASRLAGLATPRRPWLPPLPDVLDLRDGAPDARVDDAGALPVGLVDDPDRQCVEPLVWQPAAGHLLLAGSHGSGLTTTALTISGHALATEMHLYVVDAHGDPSWATVADHPACGAVVNLHERERVVKLLGHAAGEIRRLTSAPAPPGGRSPATLVVIDGIDALRRALDPPDDPGAADVAAWADVEHLAAHGASVGVHLVVTAARPGGLPGAVLAHLSQRWVFHLTDPFEALVLGVDPANVPPAVAGRLVIARCGREAQVGLYHPPPWGGAALAGGLVASRPRPIEPLPATVPAAVLPAGERGDDGALRLPIGLRFADASAAVLCIPDGDHLLVIGPSRSGRTSTLHAVVHAWWQVCRDGWVGVVSPRGRWPTGATADLVAMHATDVLAVLPAHGPCLLVADDADGVADHEGTLAALVASRRPGLLVVAAGAPDALRALYGHWTGVVRRSRTGLVSAACSDLDGDLVGAGLPRRPPIASRPGLAWSVAHGEVELVQVAAVDPAPDGSAPGARDTLRSWTSTPSTLPSGPLSIPFR